MRALAALVLTTALLFGTIDVSAAEPVDSGEAKRDHGAVLHVAPSDPEPGDSTLSVGDFSLEGYGVINYFAFDWETDPARRNVVDLERFVLYPGYQFSENVQLLGEIEFEHGGTGVTKELDVFEEFGEFETEVEAGGEVLLEQLNVRFQLNDALALRVGKFKIPIGLAGGNDEPNEYFATTRAESEVNVIPTNWYEVGVHLEGRSGPVSYSAGVVNGLNSAEFSAAQWVVRGRQVKFEEVAAENFAVTGRVDLVLNDESFVGVSAYTGNSADNRRKSELPGGADARVTVVDGHLQWIRGPFTGRAVVLYGHLQNSDIVSEVNRNLSRNLNAKGTPVGSEVLSYRAEAGYNVLSFFDIPDPWRADIFARYAYYDTQYKTEGDVTNDGLWERTVYTGGVRVQVVEGVVFKGQYDRRNRGRGRVIRGAPSGTSETTISVGMGIQF